MASGVGLGRFTGQNLLVFQHGVPKGIVQTHFRPGHRPARFIQNHAADSTDVGES